MAIKAFRLSLYKIQHRKDANKRRISLMGRIIKDQIIAGTGKDLHGEGIDKEVIYRLFQQMQDGFATGIVSAMMMILALSIFAGNPTGPQLAILGIFNGIVFISGAGSCLSGYSFSKGASISRYIALFLNLGILITTIILMIIVYS